MPAVRRNNQQGFLFVGTLINILFGVLLSILLVRLIFRVLGANADNAFVNWVYVTSEPFIRPFFGIFNTPAIDTGVGRFEIETLVALVIYAIIAGILSRLFSGGYHPAR